MVSWVRNEQGGVWVRYWTYKVPQKTSEGRLVVTPISPLRKKTSESDNLKWESLLSGTARLL